MTYHTIQGGRKTRVCMTIDRDLVEVLRILARKDGRSLSQFVNFRLRQAVAREHAVRQNAEAPYPPLPPMDAPENTDIPRGVKDPEEWQGAARHETGIPRSAGRDPVPGERYPEEGYPEKGYPEKSAPRTAPEEDSFLDNEPYFVPCDPSGDP